MCDALGATLGKLIAYLCKQWMRHQKDGYFDTQVHFANLVPLFSQLEPTLTGPRRWQL